MRRPCRSTVALAVAAAIATGLGCGPIVYVSEVTRHASDSVEAARAANAEKYAPYWWTRATQYLTKAREVAAHADFQGANRFGRLAAEAADQATQEALIAARDPSKRPLDLVPDVAPAKEPSGAVRSPPAPDTPAPAKAPPTPAKAPPAPAKAPLAPAKAPPAPAKAPPAARPAPPLAPAKDSR
ncbi:MAG TPA: DUF4398 domain-containing protein [Kofleriaceae bacterium]|nr:DUF4398 domain-containing protein [Kofleriaceae bacterium]